jgi:ADP-heptose:LPS heptosyltransferase
MKIRTAFIRHIALGDCLLSLPIIKQYKSERSEHQIYLFTCTKNIDPNQYIRKVFEIRLKYQSIIKNYHKVIYLDYEFFPKLHILDAYSLVTGINLKEKIIPFVIKEKYKNKAKKILNIFKIKQPYVCINVQTGHHLRNYPLNKAQEIINCIKVNGFEVIVLADISNDLNNCVNLSKFKFNIKNCSRYNC